MLFKKTLHLIMLIAGLGGLAGCGFKPLFSESQPTTSALNHVKVSIIKDRIGQQVRNRLLDLMMPAGEPTTPKYQLVITLSESQRELSFRKDFVARRTEMSLKAHFELVDTKTGKTAFKNFSEAYTSFSMGSHSDFAAYSSYASEKDAQSRMVEALAQDIRLQVSSFLLSHERESVHEDLAGKI